MGTRIREVDSVTLLDLDGNIDINSSDIIETIGWLLGSSKCRIVLNFENVDTVDYHGLSVLAIAYKNVMNHKGKLKFLHVPLPVIELFKVVKLDGVFDTYTSERAALESFHASDVEQLHLRRKFKRLDMHLNLSYRPVGTKKGKWCDGNVLNVSGAGIYVYTAATFPVCTSLDLRLHLPESNEPLESSGKVIYVADKQIQPHYYPGMGVSFFHLTQEKERLIIEFIDKNISFRPEPE